MCRYWTEQLDLPQLSAWSRLLTCLLFFLLRPRGWQPLKAAGQTTHSHISSLGLPSRPLPVPPHPLAAMTASKMVLACVMCLALLSMCTGEMPSAAEPVDPWIAAYLVFAASAEHVA